MNKKQLHELLYQALETEIGGQQIYKTAIQSAVTAELKEEWEKYLGETERHEQVLRDTFAAIGLDPEQDSPGRQVLKYKANALVKAMEMAREAGKAAAELAAAECVVEAETKDHMNWQLLGHAADQLSGREAKAIEEAVAEVEEEEDEHLYHTMGWCRELWMEFLGMPAVLPPPEEQKDVKTQIGAARAEHARDKMLKSG